MLRRTRLLLVALAGLIGLALLTVVSNYLGGRSGEAPRPDAGEPRMKDPQGRVRTAGGSPPPPGTRVVALGPGPRAETVPDSYGEFRFDPVPVGTWGYEVVAGPLRSRATAFEGSFVEITLPGRFSASGRVVDAGTGEPVAEAEVRCGGRRTTTGARGRFRLEGIAAPGGIPAPVEVRPPGGDLQTFEPDADAAWDDLFLRLE